MITTVSLRVSVELSFFFFCCSYFYHILVAKIFNVKYLRSYRNLDGARVYYAN